MGKEPEPFVLRGTKHARRGMHLENIAMLEGGLQAKKEGAPGRLLKHAPVSSKWTSQRKNSWLARS